MSEAEDFQRDGACVVRGLLDEAEVERLREGVEQNLSAPSERAIEGGGENGAGRFFEDFRNWAHIAAYEDVIRGSRLGKVAAQLMGSQTVRLHHDHLLVKEPGTTLRTPWHQDQPFYNIDGSDTVSFWIPLDPVPRESTLEFVAGSQAARTWYMPRSFFDDRALVFEEGTFENVPDVEADRDAFPIVGWELEPGDAVAFNMLTLHAAAGSRNRRRAFSVRLVGDDVRFALRAVLAQPFAVILMDVRMPTMDGYETATLIRDRMQSELTPIIFFTSFGQDETKTNSAYASGAVDFIFAPVRGDVLRAKVSAFVDLFAQSEQLQESLASITALNAELRDAHASAEAVLQNVADAIVTSNEDGAIGSFNRSARRLFGYSEAELTGRPLELIVPPAQPGAERVGRRKDGTSFAFEMDVSETQIGDRNLTISCIRDISERKEQAERDRQLEQAQFEMLARLAAVAEFRDDDTGQHTRRVGDLSVAIAERLGLPEAQLNLMRLAAPLHDVGKIAIPDAVLGKPGKLTAGEFDEMKTHTTVGAQMLAGSGYSLLELAEEIALTHHEKWDGSGYPTGLAGEAIPIAGRIVAVADVFDALTHERPYEAAWSTAEALAEMTSQAARHFDPAVLAAFLGLELAAAAA